MNHHGAEKEFITAFWQIYEHKPLEKISIKELCIKAGYNRTTFYVSYQNIYDLLDKAVDDLLSPVIEQIYEIDDLESLLKGNLIRPLFLKFFPQRSGYIEIIFKRNQYYILTEKIKFRLLDFIKAQLKNDFLWRKVPPTRGRFRYTAVLPWRPLVITPRIDRRR